VIAKDDERFPGMHEGSFIIGPTGNALLRLINDWKSTADSKGRLLNLARRSQRLDQ
jgi:hypothetical protein